MFKLIYISHPAVNIDKTKPPHMWGLSKIGFEEAKTLLQKPFWSEVDIIYSSNEPKATQVASLASEKYNIQWIQEEKLGEADRTATPFMPLEEYMDAIQQCYVKPSENIKGWESHHHMMERNISALEEIKKENKKTIVIIGHGGAGTTIKCYIKGVKLNFSEDPKRTGCIFIADLDKNFIVQDWTKY